MFEILQKVPDLVPKKNRKCSIRACYLWVCGGIAVSFLWFETELNVDSLSSISNVTVDECCNSSYHGAFDVS